MVGRRFDSPYICLSPRRRGVDDEPQWPDSDPAGRITRNRLQEPPDDTDDLTDRAATTDPNGIVA
jgi:hypothetical protein